jgi:hypothetical protein
MVLFNRLSDKIPFRMESLPEYYGERLDIVGIQNNSSASEIALSWHAKAFSVSDFCLASI